MSETQVLQLISFLKNDRQLIGVFLIYKDATVDMRC